MGFVSILYNDNECAEKQRSAVEQPVFFEDLGLNQIINAVVAPKEEYGLTPLYYAQLTDSSSVIYRQEIMRDVETVLYDAIQNFAFSMRNMRLEIDKSQKFLYTHQKESCFLDAVDMYCNAVIRLYDGLRQAEIRSEGFRLLAEYLSGYLQTGLFTSLHADTERLKTALSAIKYCVGIDGLRVQVSRSNAEINYSDEIENVFAKFKEKEAKDYSTVYSHKGQINHIEAQILDGVAAVYPDVFSDLGTFCTKYPTYVDATILRLDRELQFYVAYADYIQKIKDAGFCFCYPDLSAMSKAIYAYETFDLALAKNQVNDDKPLVVNDFELSGRERMLVVSGPNQGGKTTLARTFGQLHFIACLGLPVPGKKAVLYLPDQIFTHFEKEEDITTLNGKLQNDLIRIHAIMQQATSNSIVVLNEIFNSTALADQIFLSKQIMELLLQKDVLGVWVTFIDELASYSEQTVSMVSDVDSSDPALRTYKIKRSPANGLVYALSIAEKYRLTYHFLKERLCDETAASV